MNVIALQFGEHQAACTGGLPATRRGDHARFGAGSPHGRSSAPGLMPRRGGPFG